MGQGETNRDKGAEARDRQERQGKGERGKEERRKEAKPLGKPHSS